MKYHTVIYPTLTIASLALILTGCASEPVPEPVVVQAPILSGEQMLNESQRLANLGDRWKMVKSWLIAVQL